MPLDNTVERTVIFRDDFFGDPLAYWVRLSEGYTKLDVIDAVAAEHAANTGIDIEVLRDDISIDLVYPGSIAPTDDWRE